MRRYGRRVCAAFFFLVSILCFYRGGKAAGAVHRFCDMVTVRVENGISAELAAEILEKKEEEEALYPVFWSEETGVYIKGEASGREAEVSLLHVMGNAGILFPSGNCLGTEDEKGCLLDRETAEELFGFGNVIGQQILYGNRAYVIRGILEEEEHLMVIQTLETEEQVFLAVTVKDRQRQPGEIVRILEGKYGISGDTEEWALFYGMAKAALLLFPLAVSLWLLVWIYSRQKGAVRKGEKLFWRCCFDICLLGICVGAAMQIQIPQDMIPSTWSDFGFWSGLWKKKTEALSFLMEMKKASFQGSIQRAFFESVLMGIFSLLLFFLAAFWVHIDAGVSKEE